MKMVSLMLTPRLYKYLVDQRMSSVRMLVKSATLLQVRDGDMADVSVYFQHPTTGNIFSDQFPVRLSLLIEFGAIAANGSPIKSDPTNGEVFYSLPEVDLDKYRIPEPSESRYGIMPPTSQNPVDGSVLDEINKLTFEQLEKSYQSAWYGVSPPYSYVAMDPTGLQVWPEPKAIVREAADPEPELPNPRKGLRQIEV